MLAGGSKTQTSLRAPPERALETTGLRATARLEDLLLSARVRLHSSPAARHRGRYEEPSLDAAALGRLLADSTGAPAAVVSVVFYPPLADPEEPEVRAVQGEALRRLEELARREH